MSRPWQSRATPAIRATPAGPEFRPPIPSCHQAAAAQPAADAAAHPLKGVRLSRVTPLLVLVHRQRQGCIAHGRQHIHEWRLQQGGTQVAGAAVEQGAGSQAARTVRLQGHQPRGGPAWKAGAMGH